MGADQSGLFQRRKKRSSTMSPIRERSECSTRQEIHETKQPLEKTSKPPMMKGRLTIGDIQLENIDDVDDVDDDEYIRPDTPRPDLMKPLVPPTVNVLPSDIDNNNTNDKDNTIGVIVSHAVPSRGSPSPTISNRSDFGDLTPSPLPLTPVSQKRITPRSSANSSHKGDVRAAPLKSNGGLNLSDYLTPSSARLVTTTVAGQVEETHALPSVSV